MKGNIKEYFNVLIYFLCGLIIILSTYNIIINIKHALYLNKVIVVSDIDNDFKEYKNNIVSIENNLEKNKSSNLYNPLYRTVQLMKSEGVYRLMPGDKLYYIDLYRLSSYFVDTIINDGWVANLKQINKYNTNFDNEYVNILINNANYINKELLNNSNFRYDSNKKIRNTIVEEYNYILSMYKSFSSFILELSNKME